MTNYCNLVLVLSLGQDRACEMDMYKYVVVKRGVFCHGVKLIKCEIDGTREKCSFYHIHKWECLLQVVKAVCFAHFRKFTTFAVIGKGKVQLSPCT